MPRYFFDVFDGEDISRDAVGIDLDHEDMAAEHAAAALPDVAHDELPDGMQRDFWVKVRPESGDYIFTADLKFKADWLKNKNPAWETG
ncbi:DUF6894 family protein [Mesorhizobium sp. IMUNJ 23232]|uniref:DUF6894 family protein n=1 Tax=Mesorhizobium sp. IMUNJ 23232 TaxID=3376064 RepID=UPI0037883061